MTKKSVVIGLLGPVLDNGKGAARWEKWRPTVALCQHADFVIDRLELLYQAQFIALANMVEADIKQVSPETLVRRHAVEFQNAWDFQEVYGALHDFARGYKFNTEREDYLVHITTGTHVAQICLFLLVESRRLPARLIQTSPGSPRAELVPGGMEIIDLDLSKYDAIASRFKQERREAVSFLKSGIETRNKDFNRLIARIEQVAIRSRAPILLTGETGVGKSQLARRIYELRKSRNQVKGAFVEINCATLRGDTAMSTLFGHTRGSFTGANTARDGLLKTANGGILFLDEIGELGADEQAMLLRALEEKRFLPVGSDKETESNFQLLAGTNQDLSRCVTEGKFREDLYARINLWTFRLPTLHERAEDIEPNLDYELEQFAVREGAIVSFNKEARERYLTFAVSRGARWSGNFRDLNASVTRMATLAPAGRITPAIVEEEIERLRAAWRGVTSAHESSLEDKANQDLKLLIDKETLTAIDSFDRVQLAYVIGVCQASGTLSEAGRRLFNSSRENKRTANDADRLRKYLTRFGLEWQTVKRPSQF